MSEFRCQCCGEWHDEPPFAYHAHAPAYWSADLADDPDSELGEEQCIIGGEHYFVRGRIRIPVHGTDDAFEWGVWVSLSEESFWRMHETWTTPGREEADPMFGWLSTELSLYPPTLNLEAVVRIRPVGERPVVELEPTGHPLAVEQQAGITVERVQQIAEQLLHPKPALSVAQAAVFEHVRGYFTEHEVSIEHRVDGPLSQRLPSFHVIRVAPGPRTALWTYVSAGCWDAVHDDEHRHGLEFVAAGSTEDDDLHVHRLAMLAYYHCNPDDPTYRLDVGHTVPIGEPYRAGSSCDCTLVCLPYPFGPDLEECRWDTGHARLLWSLPITTAERDFKARDGLEALEQHFDAAQLVYWDLGRDSVV